MLPVQVQIIDTSRYFERIGVDKREYVFLHNGLSAANGEVRFSRLLKKARKVFSNNSALVFKLEVEFYDDENPTAIDSETMQRIFSGHVNGFRIEDSVVFMTSQQLDSFEPGKEFGVVFRLYGE